MSRIVGSSSLHAKDLHWDTAVLDKIISHQSNLRAPSKDAEERCHKKEVEWQGSLTMDGGYVCGPIEDVNGMLPDRSWYAHEDDISSMKDTLRLAFPDGELNVRSISELIPAFPYHEKRGKDYFVSDDIGRLVAVLHDKSLSKRRVKMDDAHGRALINAYRHSPPLKRSGKGWSESQNANLG